jgi:hypothetical protein
MRMAYVAQHSFHHIENHLDMTPNQYIQWRYEINGEDRQALNRVTMQATDEEVKIMRTPRIFSIANADGTVKKETRVIDRLTGMRRPERKGGFEYEVAFERMSLDKNMWLTAKQLEEYGFIKAIRVVDAKADAQVQNFAVTLRPIRGGEPAPHSSLACFRAVCAHEVRLLADDADDVLEALSVAISRYIGTTRMAGEVRVYRDSTTTDDV